MAKQKKISSKASAEELEIWLQKQLDATTELGSGHQKAPQDPDDPFYCDAMEGLGQFSSTAEIFKQTSAVNRSLQQKIGAGRRKKRLDSTSLFWYIIAVVVILLLVVIAFVILRMRMGQI